MTIDTTTLPEPVLSLYVLAENRLAGTPGISPEDARKRAFREVQHAGWYQTEGGWQQLTADVRDKVNVRRAEPQGDGSFVIRDVDVFYPNAVKEVMDENTGERTPVVYTAEDIVRAIENTNRAISEGGQRPALSREHPHLAQKFIGKALPALGAAVNWSESPRGPGWARCDLVDVEAETVDEWRQKKWTGLSAGFVKDAGGLNLRFGHVALLGVDSQALSALPMTEIFASGNQLLFSADESAIQKGSDMSRKTHAVTLSAAYAAVASAFAAVGTGEPGADAKLKEAYSSLDSARTQFCGNFSDDMPAEDKDKDEETEEKFDATAIDGTPSAEPKLPATVAKQGADAIGQEDQTTEAPKGPSGTGGGYSADSAGNFANSPEFKQMKKQMDALMTSNRAQTTVVHALTGKLARQDFSAHVDGLANAGHVFDKEAVLAQFDASKGDPGMVTAIKKFLATTPKKSSLADLGVVFGADDRDAVTGAGATTPNPDEDRQVRDILASVAPSIQFSAQDIEFGNIMAGYAKAFAKQSN
jgi:hypothetical protein